MKIIIIALLLLVFGSSKVMSQEYIYEQEVKEYLQSLSSTKYQGSLYIVHLLDFEDFDGKRSGVYKFGTFGSHQRPFILFYDGKEISIKKSYDPLELTIEAIDFIKKQEVELTKLEQAIYLENIIYVIKKNINPEGSLPLPDQEHN